MKKYSKLLHLSWQNGLVYRTSIIMWRLRQFLSTLMALTVWSVIFQSNSTAFDYTQSSMTTYIFLVAFLQSLILASSHNGLASRIYSGEISNQLLKPINLFGYFAVEEIADKAKNIGFLFVEMALLYFIFQPLIIIPDLFNSGIFLLWSLAGVLLNFAISLLFGSLGFWSPETWGPRFLFFMIVEFTAGKLFPLDILPETIQTILAYTPFPYLSFIQIQLFLGRLTQTEILQHSFGLLFWLGTLGIAVHYIWKRGLHSYEAAGR